MKIFYKIFYDKNKNDKVQKEILIDKRIVLSKFLEILNIPSFKVDGIVVNEKFKNLDYVLKDNDNVEIFLFTPYKIDFELNFVCDIHLGKLVKYLRMLGFDTLLADNKHKLFDILSSQNRIFLTKDRKIASLLKVKSCILISSNPYEQIREITYKLQLNKFSKPFTRCVVCNCLLVSIDKQQVRDLLPPKVNDYQNEFFICNSCKKIYWKGTHYDRMINFIESLKNI